MRILLSNDDGYQAQGIQILKQTLISAGHQVYLVAPDRNRSACSSSLTVRAPLQPLEVAQNAWVVKEGTPADCIHLALLGMLKFEPDAVIAGINDAPNLGDDTLYSGTLAAALEARFIKGPKLAVSLNYGNRFKQAAEITQQLLAQLAKHPHQDIFNINLPNLPANQIRGWRATRLGRRLKSHPMRETIDALGNTIYHIGAAGESHHQRQGTDFEAIDEGYISITPIQTDLTNHAGIENLSQFLDSQLKPELHVSKSTLRASL